MLFNCVVIIAKKQTAYCNPFRPVETRLNLSKHVGTRSDLLKHVWTCRNTFQSVQICPDPFPGFPPSPFSIPPPPPFPLSFFFGGGEGEGGAAPTTTTKNPRKGVGGRSPPSPHRILTTKSNQNSQNLCNLLQNLCNNLPTLEVSLSPQLQKLHKLMLSSHSFIHSLWHTEMIWNLKKPPPPKYLFLLIFI